MSGSLAAAAASAGGIFRATLNRTAVNGSSVVPGTVQTVQSVTCTGVSGIPPYTYGWAYVSGDANVYPNNGTLATTRFSKYFSGAGSASAVYKCTVTDAAVNVVDSANVSIHLEGNT